MSTPVLTFSAADDVLLDTAPTFPDDPGFPVALFPVALFFSVVLHHAHMISFTSSLLIALSCLTKRKRSQTINILLFGV